MRKSHNFRKMEIWRQSMDLVKKVYVLAAKLPDYEKFGLIYQMQRCAVSIPSNIAEGSGRTTDKEFAYFLKVAMSSSYELETQLILSSELFNFDSEEIITDLKNVQNMIGGFLRKIIEK